MNLLHKIRYQKFRLNSNTKFDTNPTVDDQHLYDESYENKNQILTCPKGFGLKLAKLGLKIPLKIK